MNEPQDYTEEQKAAIAAVNNTLTAVGLPTYTNIEDRLYQTLTACMESIEMGKKLYQELTLKRDAEKQVVVSVEDLPELKKSYQKALKDIKESFDFKGREVLVAYAKYLIEYLEGKA